MARTNCGFSDTPQTSGRDLLAALGPTLLVDIGFDPNFDPRNNPIQIPVPGIRDVQALVDTGATESCIDSLLAAQLKLPVVDRRRIAGVGGAQEVNVHLAQVRVPSLDQTIYGAFAAVHLAAGGQAHLALLGRTFLQHFTMTYEGRTGTVTIHNE
jgi:predicted aspartyl protease